MESGFELLTHFKQYFKLNELFSDVVVKKYHEQAWTFLDEDIMRVILWIREGIGRGVTINKGTSQQRGFRENTCSIVSEKTIAKQTYCSAHGLGKGVDLDVSGHKAEEVRQWIKENINDCPHAIRLEKNVNWVHVDVCNMSENKLVEFSETKK